MNKTPSMIEPYHDHGGETGTGHRSPKLRKFVDPLPRLETLKPKRKSKKSAYFEVTMDEFRVKMHRDLPPTRVWGYNRSVPGPLFDVNQGEPIRVKWINNLPDRHFLPIDHSFMHGDHLPEVRTVVHLHGSETKADSDGYPESWYTRNFQEKGPTFTREIYEYPNHQRASTLWYHDHAMGITRLNVYAGLVGMYIIRDKEERKLPLPKGEYEIPLIIMDRSFNRDGSLFYPTGPDNASENIPHPSVVPFFAGDTILVNGKVWPHLEVEPRKYRFRILNAANGRTFNLYLDNGEPFNQIGSDGGLLSKPVKVETLSLMPAERGDVIIDFSKYKGKVIHLKNNLGPNADPDDETDDVMQFRVTKRLKGKDRSRIPSLLTPIPSLKNEKVKGVRYLKLVGKTDEFDRPLLLLNNRKWSDPVTEKPILGTTEIWNIINTTNFPHPIHIHLIQFQVLDRQSFDLEHYNETGEIKLTGPILAPEPNERGWKDTVNAPAGQITRLIMRFSPYAGKYVWHCHILEHEDYDMMRPLEVVELGCEKIAKPSNQ